MPVTEAYLGKDSYFRWLEAIKIAQRPFWTGEEVPGCFICEIEFGWFERQHHCRKCGTAVCWQCSKFFVTVPELAYYNRVRLCRFCLEEQFKEQKAAEMLDQGGI